MLRLRHLDASIQDCVCLAAGDNKISLIEVSPLRCRKIAEMTEHVDGRVALLSLHKIVVYADYYKGIKAINFEGNSQWTLSEKKMTRLRVSQDGNSLIACRNDPPEVLLIDPTRGKIVERIQCVTDGFFESVAGARALLNLNNNLVISRAGNKSEVHWGQFGLFSGFFHSERFYVSGTGRSLGVYDLETRSLVSSIQSQSFVKCKPFAVNQDRKELTGVVFEHEGKPVTSLVSFDESLNIKSVITTTPLVWDAVIFAKGEKMFTSNGKLFDTSTGLLTAELDISM